MRNMVEEKEKILKSVIVTSLSLLFLLYGVLGFAFVASADTILFPYVAKNLPSVTTFISVINKSGSASHLKYIYRHKDTAADLSASCATTSFTRPTFGNDIVSFDMAGIFNGGNALYNDGSGYGGTFHLQDTGGKRAYFVVSHSDSSGNRVNTGNNKSLEGEAIIMDIAFGAAWGYKAINDADREDYTFTNSGTNLSALDAGESISTAFFPPNDWYTKYFVTPIGSDMDTASLTGSVALNSIYDRNGISLGDTSAMGVACVGSINVTDFMNATTQSAVATTGGWAKFSNQGNSPVLVYKLEYVMNNPSFGGTNNNGFCLSCSSEKEASAPPPPPPASSGTTTPPPSGTSGTATSGGKTWTVTVVNYLDAGSAQLTISTDPTNRLINLSWKGLTGHVWYCFVNSFVLQGSNQFDLNPQWSSTDLNSSMFVAEADWSGCSYIDAGATETAFITHIPSYFNFNAPFTFVDDSMNSFLLQ